MTLQSLNAPIIYPCICPAYAGAVATNVGSLLDAAGEYEAVVIQARQAMSISHVAFRTVSATGSPTADVRIETLDASGNPSGTLWSTTTNIVTGTLTSAWATQALTSTATIVAGDKFAVKIAYNSGTSLNTRIFNNMRLTQALPLRVTNLNSTLTRVAMLTDGLGVVLGSSSSTFYSIQGLYPIESIAQNAFNNTSSAARGVRFQVPFPCRCVGMRFFTNTNNGDFNFAIYDDSGSELSSSSTTMDGDFPQVGGTAVSYLYFDSPVSLSANTNYRAAVEPSSSTNCNISVFTLASANHRSAMPGGTNYTYATRASGTWDDTNTTMVPMMDLLIDQFDDAAGGGTTGASRARVQGGF